MRGQSSAPEHLNHPLDNSYKSCLRNGVTRARGPHSPVAEAASCAIPVPRDLIIEP